MRANSSSALCRLSRPDSTRALLDALDKGNLAPPPPALLGTALKELRNLRATHALRAGAPRAAAPKTDEAPQ